MTNLAYFCYLGLMLNVALIFIFSFFPLAVAFSSSPLTQFIFVGEPQIVNPNELSGDLKIQAQNSSSVEQKTEETIDLYFLSTSLAGEFLNSAGNPVSKVMGKGTANRTFYYRDSIPGVYTLTVRATGRESGESWTATQQISVSGEDGGSGQSSAYPLSSSTAQSNTVIIPSIKADAGGNRMAVAGSLVDFRGNALGLKDEPLENARFWWNFGDGNTMEARSTLHVFRVPGTYTVGLHVSSGQYASSDYITVIVAPNQLEVAGVIHGEDGYIRLTNNGKTEIDFGGWIMEDSLGKRFIVPIKTIIAPQVEISLLNSITSLFSSAASPYAIIRYPNGREAVRWSAPVPSPNNAQHSMLNTSEIVAESNIGHSALNNDSVSGESEPESKELASAASTELAAATASGVNSKIFFPIAASLSLLVAVGFFLVKKFYL